MAKTYLQLVNDVLVRLREDEVGSVDDTPYSKLIGRLVNDAKDYVEDAFEWNVLTTQQYIYLVADIREYGCDQVNGRAKILQRPDDPNRVMAYDVTPDATGGFELLGIPSLEMERRRAEYVYTFDRQANPTLFAPYYTEDTVNIKLLEYPSQVRYWSIWFKGPQDELEADADTLLVPHKPVVMFAKMLALHERGEETGEPGNLAALEAQRSLADAVSLDLKDRRWLVDAF